MKFALDPVVQRRWRLLYPMCRLKGTPEVSLLQVGIQPVQADGRMYPIVPQVEVESYERLFCPYCHARIPRQTTERLFGPCGAQTPYDGTVEMRQAVVRKGMGNKRVFQIMYCPFRNWLFPVVFCNKCMSPLPEESLFNDRLSVGILSGDESRLKRYTEALGHIFQTSSAWGVRRHFRAEARPRQGYSADQNLRLWAFHFSPKKFDVSCHLHSLSSNGAGVSNMDVFRYARFLIHLVNPLDIPEIAQQLGEPTPPAEKHPTRVLHNWINQYIGKYGVDLRGGVPVSIAVVLTHCDKLAEKKLLPHVSLRNLPWTHVRGINQAVVSAVSCELENMLSKYMKELVLTPLVRTYFSAYRFFPCNDENFHAVSFQTGSPILWQLSNLDHLSFLDGEKAVRQIPELFLDLIQR
jgi:hypothetical protein